MTLTKSLCADTKRVLDSPDEPVRWANRNRVAPSLRERLAANTRRTTDGCLVKVNQAEGTRPLVSINNKKVLAARVVQYLGTGEWPPTVRHKCDNPGCIESEHLESGTHSDNMQDMVRRGRARKPGRECGKGHAMTGDNLRVYANGKRQCMACKREGSRMHYAKKRQG